MLIVQNRVEHFITILFNLSLVFVCESIKNPFLCTHYEDETCLLTVWILHLVNSATLLTITLKLKQCHHILRKTWASYLRRTWLLLYLLCNLKCLLIVMKYWKRYVNAQYSRRECLEVVGIPKEVEQKDLEGKASSMFCSDQARKYCLYPFYK